MQNGQGFALKFISYTASEMSNEQQRSENILRSIMEPPRNWNFSWLGVIGQNHSLGTKYFVGVRCCNYSELKELYFMVALDTAKAMCAENKQEKYLKDGRQQMGRGREWFMSISLLEMLKSLICHVNSV